MNCDNKLIYNLLKKRTSLSERELYNVPKGQAVEKAKVGRKDADEEDEIAVTGHRLDPIIRSVCQVLLQEGWKIVYEGNHLYAISSKETVRGYQRREIYFHT